MFFIHEKDANSILPKSGLKHLVAVTPSVDMAELNLVFWTCYPKSKKASRKHGLGDS